MAPTTLPVCHTRTDSEDRHHPLSPFVRPSVCPSVRSFVSPFVLSFIHSFIHSFVPSFVPSYVCLPICTMTSHCENSPYSGRGQHEMITIGNTGRGGQRHHQRAGVAARVHSGAVPCKPIVPRERSLHQTKSLGAVSSRFHSFALLRATCPPDNVIWG